MSSSPFQRPSKHADTASNIEKREHNQSITQLPEVDFVMTYLSAGAQVFKERVERAVIHANPLRRLSVAFTSTTTDKRHSILKVDDGVVPIGHVGTSMTRQLAFGGPEQEVRTSKELFRRWWGHEFCLQIGAIWLILIAVIVVAVFRMKERELDRKLCDKYFLKHYNKTCREYFNGERF